ncbi:hypothetical protein BH10ACI1_BH10ACI1_25530 [soil metagenome]
MQNKIDATISTENRDRILALISQIFELLPSDVDLTPEERQSLVKMGDWGRPLVEATLTLAEQNDSFLPRSFDVTEMRKDKDLYEALSPVNVQVLRLVDAVRDIMVLTGSDLMMAAFDIYGNAKENGQGEHLDSLIPLVARRFKRKGKKKDGGNNEGGENPPS